MQMGALVRQPFWHLHNRNKINYTTHKFRSTDSDKLAQNQPLSLASIFPPSPCNMLPTTHSVQSGASSLAKWITLPQNWYLKFIKLSPYLIGASRVLSREKKFCRLSSAIRATSIKNTCAFMVPGKKKLIRKTSNGKKSKTIHFPTK